MKKTIAIIIGVLAPAAAFAQSAAEEVKKGLGATAGAAGLGQPTPLPVVVGNIISTALGLVGIIFLLLMIYGGLMWMQARGKEENVRKAKEIIWSAVIGIVIISAAYAITTYIVGKLAG